MHIVEFAHDNSTDLQNGSMHVPIQSDCLIRFSAGCFGSYLGMKNSGLSLHFHLKLGEKRDCYEYMQHQKSRNENEIRN